MKKIQKNARCVIAVATLVSLASLFLSACTTYVTPVRTVPGPQMRHPWVPGHYNRFGEWIPGHYR